MQHGISTSLLWHFGITAQYMPMYFKADMLLVRTEASSFLLKDNIPRKRYTRGPQKESQLRHLFTPLSL